MRNIAKNRVVLCSAAVISPSVVNKDDISFELPKEETKEQTGWDRLWLMYTKDEFDNVSPEISAVLQTSFMSLFVGAVYGGFKASRQAYEDFIERNQATVYENMFDAKRRLQNHVTINFGRGAFHFGWRLALFCGSFQLLLTSIATYRGNTSVMDYVASGMIAGSVYRVQLGPRGIIVGGVVGSILGLFAGSLSQFLLSFYDSSYEEVVVWQNKIRDIREDEFKKGLKAHREKDIKDTLPLLQHHEQLVSSSTHGGDKKEVK